MASPLPGGAGHIGLWNTGTLETAAIAALPLQGHLVWSMDRGAAASTGTVQSGNNGGATPLTVQVAVKKKWIEMAATSCQRRNSRSTIIVNSILVRSESHASSSYSPSPSRSGSPSPYSPWGNGSVYSALL